MKALQHKPAPLVTTGTCQRIFLLRLQENSKFSALKILEQTQMILDKHLKNMREKNPVNSWLTFQFYEKKLQKIVQTMYIAQWRFAHPYVLMGMAKRCPTIQTNQKL